MLPAGSIIGVIWSAGWDKNESHHNQQTRQPPRVKNTSVA